MNSPTPYALRVHIGIFGRSNVGKSSLLNSITKQSVAIVADEEGVTGDPVYHAFELIPVGPVVFVDTAGVGGEGELSLKREKATFGVVATCDIALLVVNQNIPHADDLRVIEALEKAKTPYIVVFTQSDKVSFSKQVKQFYPKAFATHIVSSKTNEGIEELITQLKDLVRSCQEKEPGLLDGLVKENDLVMLVTPIDQQAPKGRLILPQVMVIRQLLDSHARTIVVALEQMLPMLSSLKEMPKLVICDSQVVKAVDSQLPKSIQLTTFSVILSRFKGDLIQFAKSAASLNLLTEKTHVVIAEACSHYVLDNDIGRVKIPNLLSKKVGSPVKTTIFNGRGVLHENLEADVIVHCGACMITRKHMCARQNQAQKQKIPMTNYGMAISFLQGVLERVLSPFPEALLAYQDAKREAMTMKNKGDPS